MNVRELDEILKSGADEPLLLDVRTQMERDIARIEPSILIPLAELSMRYDELEAFRSKPIVVYCHHGIRSAHAVEWLKEMGFKDVSNLDGGIEDWSTKVDPSVPRY